MCNKLEPGDRVAYAAKFLKDTGQFSGHSPKRRGTFVKYCTQRDADTRGYCRVMWDDFEACAPALAVQWGDDYVADIREHGGTMIFSGNVAKVGSPRFALNDL